MRHERYTDEQLIQAEHERILNLVLIEQHWWGINDKFITVEEALNAKRDGLLIDVPTCSDSWKLIKSISPEKSQTGALLRLQAFQVMHYLLSEWKAAISNQPVAAAVTSLYRTLEEQMALSQHFAAPGNASSHLAGASFDVSLRSYYEIDDGKYHPVNVWSPEYTSVYVPEYMELLQQTLKDLQKQIGCNSVVEHVVIDGKLYPSVLHVCISPF